MKIDQKKIGDFVKENKWILIVSIFFLIWKFFLVGVLWHDRLSPPEPDDSYIYIAHIESIIKCPAIVCDDGIYPMTHFNGWSHLVYRLFFGYLALLLHIDSATMYYWSFYIGSVLLLPALVFFLRSFTKEKGLIAFLLLFMLLPNGGGSAHSFNWITPSFYSLLLFFIIFGIVIREEVKGWRWLVPVLVFLMLYTHTLGVYLTLGLIIFLAFYFIFLRKLDWLIIKKTLLVLLSLIIFYTPVTLYLMKVSPSKSGNAYGPEVFLKEAVGNSSAAIKADTASNEKTDSLYQADSSDIKTSKAKDDITERMFPGFKQIYNNYFKWIIFNPLSLFIIGLFLWLNIRYKQKKIVALFIANLAFLLAASLHRYGFRFLIYSWPITFIFYAFGFWFSLMWIRLSDNMTLRIILQVCWSVILVAFLSVGMLFSFFWNDYSQRKKNYHIKEGYVEYIRNNMQEGEKMMYVSPTVNALLIKDNLRKIVRTSRPSNAKMFIYLSEEDTSISYGESQLDKFLAMITKRLMITRQPGSQGDSRNKKPPIWLPKEVESNFYQSAEFGDIRIYQKKPLD